MTIRTLPLLGPLDWATVPIPAGTPDVQIARIFANPDSKASPSLVRFPAGWTRSVDVFYAVDEELVVLEGELIVSGVSYAAGQYGFIPAGSLRRLSATPNGCLALAHFGGVPGALTEEQSSTMAVGPTLRHDLRAYGVGTGATCFGAVGDLLRTSPNGGTCHFVEGELASLGLASSCEVLDVLTWTLTLAEAGDSLDLPASRYLVRCQPLALCRCVCTTLR